MRIWVEIKERGKQPMGNRVVLASTKRGFLGGIFNAAIWILILLIVTGLVSGWCYPQMSYLCEKHGFKSVAEFQEAWNKNPCNIGASDSTNMDFLWAVSEIILPTARVTMLCLLLFQIFIALIYGAKEINTFHLDDKSLIKKLVREKFGFPFSKDVNEISFDRVTEVAIRQSSWDRLLDTGTVTIKTVTFTNAEVITNVCDIPGIINPHGRKTELEKYLPGHEGVNVHLV